MTGDTIFIRGLTFNAIIGMLPAERQKPQPLVMDVTMTVDISQAAVSTDVADTVNYAEICESIKATTIAAKALLLETLAETVAAEVLNHPLVQAVQLSIGKPEAVAMAQSVGVEIYREKRPG